MHDIPGLRETVNDSLHGNNPHTLANGHLFPQNSKKDPAGERQTKSSTHPKLKHQAAANNANKYTKNRSREFDCCGWTDDLQDMALAGAEDPNEISLSGWLDCKKSEQNDSRWKPKQHWELYLAADVKSRCKAIKEDHEWKTLRYDMGTRAITEGNISTTRQEERGDHDEKSHNSKGQMRSTAEKKAKFSSSIKDNQSNHESSSQFNLETGSVDSSSSYPTTLSARTQMTKPVGGTTPSQAYRANKQNSLFYEDSFQRSKSNLCLKTSLTLEKGDVETRHELLKLRSGQKTSGHAKIPPIGSPIKYLEGSFPYRVPSDSSNSHGRARLDGSWRRREYFDDGESREPSPFAFRRQKSNADMQNYRAQKQMKVAIKIKDANFVAPASACNTIISTSPVRGQHQQLHDQHMVDETESDEHHMDNRVYTMKYTDISSRNNFYSPPQYTIDLFPRGQSLQIKGKYNGSKPESTNPLTEEITGSLREEKVSQTEAAQPSQNYPHPPRPPKGKICNTRSAPAHQNMNVQSNLAPSSGPNSINFIHPDIASEKAAIESLNLLHSLERKRKGRPIKTRLLGTEKVTCHSPDFQPRPFGVDRDGVLLGGHSATDDKPKLNDQSTSTANIPTQMATSIHGTSPNKLYTLASPQTHWKV